MLSLLFSAAGAAFILLSLVVLLRCGGFWKAFWFTALTGNGALLCVGYLAAFTSATLAVNWFTLAVATCSGIPGVIGLLLIKLIFTV